ncbi:hypothetical protein ACE6H2_021281 [Prunus campanulata]
MKKKHGSFSRANVGESLNNNNPHLLHVAKLIVDECKGLPIAIITIGKTLLSIDKNEWDTVRDQLKNSLPEIIPRMEHKDYDVPIEYLVRYGLGRAIFENINTVENARKRVHFFVGQLKRRFLSQERVYQNA